MWIKASGTWLADADARDIFVPIALEETRQAVREVDENAGCRQVLGGSQLRPSIETSLHALMPHRVVMHTHSQNTIAWAIDRAGRQRLASALEGWRWAWVEYARPGLPLTQRVSEAVAGGVPDVLILANHGLVVGAETVGDLGARLSRIEDLLGLPTRSVELPIPSKAARTWLDTGNWVVPTDPIIQALAADPVCCTIAQGGVLYPDHVVFLGPSFPLVGSAQPAGPDSAQLPDGAPPYVVFPGNVVLVHINIGQTALAMLNCLGGVTLRVADSSTVSYLLSQEVAALVDWEAEKHRQSVDAQRPS